MSVPAISAARIAFLVPSRPLADVPHVNSAPLLIKNAVWLIPA